MLRTTTCCVTSWAVLLTFTSLYADPVLAAFRLPAANPTTPRIIATVSEDTPEDKHNQLLRRIEAEVFAPVDAKSRDDAKLEQKIKNIIALDGKLSTLDLELRESLIRRGKTKSDDSITKFNGAKEGALTRFDAERASFHTAVAELRHADGVDAQSAAFDALRQYFSKRAAGRLSKLTPMAMPWRSAKRKVRSAYTSAVEIRQALFKTTEKAIGFRAASSEKVMTTPPTPGDLAESIDIQITQAIRDQAQQLGDQPIAIYDFVRNTVRTYPTHGSLQGSDVTLSKRAGNPYDISSLLIALLRAANVPARYAYGTVELPASEVMDWVGGAQTPEAALEILAQGGIPSMPVVTGGQVTSIRLEHVWVEAWLDFFPSRGAKHIAGASGLWVPLDASMKQYAFSDGMSLSSNVPVDANAVISGAEDTATVDHLAGSVSGLDGTAAQASLTSYYNNLTAYATASNPAPTLADGIGTGSLIQRKSQILSGTIASRIVADGGKFSELPDALRGKFQYSLFASAEDRASGSPIWAYTEALPNLAGKELTLVFRPATQADIDAVNALLPKPHADGSPVQPSEFAQSYPSSINVVPELRLDGSVVASGGPVPFGQQLAGRGGFTDFDLSGWDLSDDDSLVSGQPSAIGLSIQGIAPYQLSALESKLSQANASLNTGNVAGLDYAAIGSDFLTSAVWTYFATVSNFTAVNHSQAGIIEHHALSYGLAHLMLAPTTLYGTVTTGATVKGLNLDIGHLRHIRWSKTGDQAAWVQYNRITGVQASIMEGAVLEALLGNRTTCGGPGLPSCQHGISAVEAQAVALKAGDKLFTITNANRQSVNSLNVDPVTKAQIQNAIDSGLEITVHQNPISAFGYQGSGYIIMDPNTGAGAYLLAGSLNGGIFAAILAGAVLLPLFLCSAGVIGPIVATILVAIAFKNIFNWIDKIKNASTEREFEEATGGALISALSDIAFGVLGYRFFGWVAEFGGLSMVDVYAWLASLAEWLFESLFGA